MRLVYETEMQYRKVLNFEKDPRIMIFEINIDESDTMECIMEFTRMGDILNIHNTGNNIYITVGVNTVREYITNKNRSSTNIEKCIKDVEINNSTEESIVLGEMDIEVLDTDVTMVEIITNNEVELMTKIIQLHKALKKSSISRSVYGNDLAKVLYLPITIKVKSCNEKELVQRLNSLGISVNKTVALNNGEISCLVLRESVKTYLRIEKYEYNTLEKSIIRQIKQIFYVYNVLI